MITSEGRAKNENIEHRTPNTQARKIERVAPFGFEKNLTR
jgi:hypothetical protein